MIANEYKTEVFDRQQADDLCTQSPMSTGVVLMILYKDNAKYINTGSIYSLIHGSSSLSQRCRRQKGVPKQSIYYTMGQAQR